MNVCLCKRCGQFWSMAGEPDLFKFIGRICPDCIGQMANRRRQA